MSLFDQVSSNTRVMIDCDIQISNKSIYKSFDFEKHVC